MLISVVEYSCINQLAATSAQKPSVRRWSSIKAKLIHLLDARLQVKGCHCRTHH